uniref:Uncharacterized protein n=1 Tax=Rhizophora mucronata TaxID=61149 RepID=A0A2P2PN99_RHIMU
MQSIILLHFLRTHKFYQRERDLLNTVLAVAS